MKSETIAAEEFEKPSTRRPRPRREVAALVEEAIALRKSVGDGLNDTEFTQLLLRKFSREADGFAILSFCEGCLTLSVPDQDPSDWYPPDAWISADKEETARAIAEKYELSVCEPPDRLTYIVQPAGAHHHLELMNRSEAVAVAHPVYLKIRLFTTPANRIAWSAPNSALPPGAELAEKLAALYR